MKSLLIILALTTVSAVSAADTLCTLKGQSVTLTKEAPFAELSADGIKFRFLRNLESILIGGEAADERTMIEVEMNGFSTSTIVPASGGALRVAGNSKAYSGRCRNLAEKN